MFLHYLASGTREYHRTWVGQTHVHPFWELSVAISGRIAPVIADWGLKPRNRCLWAIPGNLTHGWTDDGSPAEVVVICPRWVPDALRHAASVAAREQRLPAWEMDAAAVDRLRGLAHGLLAQPCGRDPLVSLRQELAVNDLCLRMLEACPARWLRGLSDERHQVVEAALAWFTDHLEDDPDEVAVARAVHISPAHLRRLCHAVLGRSPRQEFTRLRLARADSLLLHTDWTAQRIAEACGFAGGAVSLCRLYRRERGESPGRFRQQRPVEPPAWADLTPRSPS